MTKLTLMFAVILAPVAASAITPEQCVLAYSEHARQMEKSASSYNSWGSTSTLGGTSATPFFPTYGPPAITVGTSVGSTGSRREEEAKFTANVAQAISEASGRVAGPFISQVTAELNKALYGWFASGDINHYMSREAAAKTRERLQNREVTTDDVMDAITHLARSGALCDAQGKPLSREAWAQMIVLQVTTTMYKN